MVNLRASFRPWLLVLIFTSFTGQALGRRKYDRHREADNPATIPSGWTVPLRGADNCDDPKHCINALEPPPPSTHLAYLTLARGIGTYSCVNVTRGQSPAYVSQSTQLYDAVPLLSSFTSERQFHGFVPLFLNYDYSELDNSTLDCIGEIITVDGYSVFDLFNVAAFTVEAQEKVASPNDPQHDLDWVRSVSNDDGGVWTVYRVETVGGKPPEACNDELRIQVRYVAEYWFSRN